jgi:hypothetical protein
MCEAALCFRSDWLARPRRAVAIPALGWRLRVEPCRNWYSENAIVSGTPKSFGDSRHYRLGVVSPAAAGLNSFQRFAPQNVLSPFPHSPFGYRLSAIGYSRSVLFAQPRYWLFARSALSYPYPPACTKHEWNIKNHAKLASVRIASRPLPKFLSSVSP